MVREKGVSVRECDKVSGNILKAIDKIDGKIDLIMDNHLVHMKEDIVKIKISNAKIITIMTVALTVVNLGVQLLLRGIV